MNVLLGAKTDFVTTHVHSLDQLKHYRKGPFCGPWIEIYPECSRDKEFSYVKRQYEAQVGNLWMQAMHRGYNFMHHVIRRHSYSRDNRAEIGFAADEDPTNATNVKFGVMSQYETYDDPVKGMRQLVQFYNNTCLNKIGAAILGEQLAAAVENQDLFCLEASQWFYQEYPVEALY